MSGGEVLQYRAAVLLDHVRDLVRHQAQVARRLARTKKDVIGVRKRARIQFPDGQLCVCVGVDANRSEIDREAARQWVLYRDRQRRAVGGGDGPRVKLPKLITIQHFARLTTYSDRRWRDVSR